MLEIDPARLAAARQAERLSAAEARRAARTAALHVLHEARDIFRDHAGAIYAQGADAAAQDCDWLEEIAAEIRAAVERLEPAFDRLDVARDLTLYRGAVLSRARSRYDPQALAALVAEALGSALLSVPAGQVLCAAIAAGG